MAASLGLMSGLRMSIFAYSRIDPLEFRVVWSGPEGVFKPLTT